MSASKSDFWTYVFAFFVFLLIVVLFILTLGQLDTDEFVSKTDFHDKRDEAKRKHKWYSEILKNQKKLKEELDRKFKIMYLSIRILLLLSWAALIGVTYFLGLAANFLELFGLASLPLWFISGANYLTNGTYMDLKDFIEITKVKTENWVYGKYIDLDEKIDRNEGELLQIEKSIS
jgi:hypothetical protein